MADFNALETLINAYIKQNGVQAITGQVLNGVLRGMVSALGKGWTIAGDAEPTTDPGTMTGPVAYIAHTAGTYANFGNLVVNDGEVAFLKYNEQTWTKEVLASLAATASVDGNVGTPSVTTSFVNGVLNFAFQNLKGNPGNDGDSAGFGTVAATVDNTIGTPAVSVSASGPDTAKNFTFAFTGLKGATGVTSAVVTVDNTVGTPQCAVSLVGQELHLDFTGLKGAQGDTGVSADYPIAIVNNVTTNDPAQALSAAMGVQLESEISQLDLEVNGFDTTTEVLTPQPLTADKTYNTNVSTMATSPADNEGYYCTRIAVTPGEVYRLSGVRSTSKYTLLFATANSSRARLRRDEQGDGSRVTIDVTIETGEAWLYVNLGSYNSATDGVWKVTNVTEHTDGLTDDVENLEDAVDEINGNAVTTETAQEVLIDKYINMGLNTLKGRNNLPSSVGDACCYIYVKPGEKYNIYGEGTSAYLGLYCFADAKLNIKYKSGAMNTRTNGLVVEIPEGIEILGVNLVAYDSDTDKVEKITTTNVSGYKAYIDTECVSILKPFAGKKIVVFGDSITENTYNGKHYSDYIADITGATIINVGVGGTQLRQRTTPVDTPTSTLEAYAALDIVNMVKASCDGVFTKQVNAAQYLKDNASDDNTAIVASLASIDWSDVWLVIVFGGTNDWKNAGADLGATGSTNVNKTLGATNEIIRMLLTAYPYLLIQFVSPIVRWISYSDGTGTDANWGDTYKNAGDITLKEFVEILGNEVELNHIPFQDIYNNLGWNKTNFAEYFGENDGTHPTYGLRFIGRKIARHLLATLQY